ncbi:MAG: T9SS type A sorting domain-containing protein [Taibaiella sp.]|nr:T9SS type A sorting domain-containing protein [Taibaiella sp.]
MHFLKAYLLFFILLGSYTILYADNSSVWQLIPKHASGNTLLQPAQAIYYSLDTNSLWGQLHALPDDPAKAKLIDLPMPSGTFRTFRMWRTHIMLPGMEARYAAIQTYNAAAVDDARVSGKIDITCKGFHAMIFDGENTSFIDPFSDVNDGYYTCYYRRDYHRPLGNNMTCATEDDSAKMNNSIYGGKGAQMRLTNGNQLQTYRLALACTGEYAIAVSGIAVPTKALVLSAITTSINRVNGVYERELSITMQFVSNEDTLIFLKDTVGSYSNFNGINMLTQNQDTIDRRIGPANYDIGHVFSTGGTGIAQIACVCRNSMKAEGVTGKLNPVGDSYDIDYVAHEMGHQFGADHTFNDNNNGSCGGNANFLQSYEPGSGSTIMAYAGICDNDNLQVHSDAYFHAVSLYKIVTYTHTPFVATCAMATTIGNKAPSLPAFSASYNIPFLTPFEITAPSTIDSVADTSHTYCWEEWDLGDYGATFANTHISGPIFRSLMPATSSTRVFPKIDMLVKNITNYLGEKLPDVARKMNFRLTSRTIYNGVGSINIPDDSIHVNVINTATPFSIIYPTVGGIIWHKDSSQGILWKVSNTDASPINCTHVDIYLSIDGGYTYPYLLLAGIPNSGFAAVQAPDITTTHARIKIKASDNIFFNISNNDFSIETGGSIDVYPVPAGPATGNVVHIHSFNTDRYQFVVYNIAGKRIMTDYATEQYDINIATWAKGIYYIKLWNARTGSAIIKSIVVL